MYESSIYANTQGEIIFVKFNRDTNVAFPTVDDSLPDAGLKDLMTFHEGWGDDENPPGHLELPGNRTISIFTQDATQWRRRVQTTREIASASARITIHLLA